MLGDTDATATIAVRNIAAAKGFYEDTLGLEPAGTEEPGALFYKSGNSKVLVYESKYAGTNKATSATWAVGGGVDRVVKMLKAKGVTFEHYDFPGTTREGDVHVTNSIRAAWFKDPDGNILALVSK
jgi:catechol 2,3-dioxygenase-like lactoylglutathione lyase family enzyme